MYSEYDSDKNVREKRWFYRWTAVISTIFMVLTIFAFTIYLLLIFDTFMANKLKIISTVLPSAKPVADTAQQPRKF